MFAVFLVAVLFINLIIC